jgi:CheY-like chemotaxis protein
VEGKPLILVADDEVLIRTLFSRALNSLGCSVVAVSSGEKALSSFKTIQFDMVVLDWNMPELDGFETAIKMRESEIAAGTSIPIVIISANPAAVEKVCTRVDVVNAVFSKPFGKTDFRDLLKRFLPSFDTAANPQATT